MLLVAFAETLTFYCMKQTRHSLERETKITFELKIINTRNHLLMVP